MAALWASRSSSRVSTRPVSASTRVRASARSLRELLSDVVRRFPDIPLSGGFGRMISREALLQLVESLPNGAVEKLLRLARDPYAIPTSAIRYPHWSGSARATGPIPSHLSTKLSSVSSLEVSFRRPDGSSEPGSSPSIGAAASVACRK
jgi:hypothetical protein